MLARRILQAGDLVEVVVVEPGIAGVWVSEAEVNRVGDVLVASVDMVSVGSVLDDEGSGRLGLIRKVRNPFSS